MRKTLILLFLFFGFFFLKEAFAQDFPNNKFGIHLSQPSDHDLEAAAKLVNSSGGDWGYVTLVIQENDKDLNKWQEIFNKLRRLHLIPIIRLATKPEGGIWRRPTIEDIPSWVNFLDSLNWVVKNRYVILFNEPNHASEWGGAVDPQNYKELAFSFAKALKEKNLDFFVMLAGFDSAAPSNPPYFEDEEIFLQKMLSHLIDESKNIFDYIDGWASHSYPKDYLGSPYDFGRNSIRTYQWELNLLKKLGVKKELPVFITETGWKQQIQNSKFKSQNYLDSEMIGRYFQIAFENVWGPDERVLAVTPFILNYQQEPFLEFSWRMINEGDFYPQYYMVQNIPKIKGEPVQKYKITIQTKLPTKLIENSVYRFQLTIDNQGQAILDKNDGHRIIIKKDDKNNFPFEEYFFSDFLSLEPGKLQVIDFHLKTNDRLGDHQLKFFLFKNENFVAELFSWQFKISPWPSLAFKVRLSPKLKTFGNDFEIQIFDKNEQLVYKKKNIEVKNGKGRLERIANIVLGERYRVVILKPYYLPRQNFIVFKKNENKISFSPMLPFDLNLDGKFSFTDLLIFVKKPQFFLP